MQFPRIETSWWDRFFWARALVRRSALYDRRVRRVYRIVAIPRSDAKIKNKEKLYFQEKILHRRLLYFKRGWYEAEMEKHFVCFQEDAFSNTNECTIFHDLQQWLCFREIHIDALLIARLLEFFANWSIPRASHRFTFTDETRHPNHEMHYVNKDSRESGLHNSLAMPTFLRVSVTHGLPRTKQNLIKRGESRKREEEKMVERR